MRRFVVYNQSAVLFLLHVVGGRRIFLDYFSFLCLCLNCYVANILSVSSKTKACARQIFTTVSSTAFVHRQRHNQPTMIVPHRGFEGIKNDKKNHLF